MKLRVLKTVFVATILTVGFLTLAPNGQTRHLMEHDNLATANLLSHGQLGLEIDSAKGTVKMVARQQHNPTRTSFVSYAFAQEPENLNSQLQVVELITPPPGVTPPGGSFPITATIKNISQDGLSGLFFRVAALDYLEVGNTKPEFANADRGGTGVGAEKDANLPVRSATAGLDVRNHL